MSEKTGGMPVASPEGGAWMTLTIALFILGIILAGAVFFGLLSISNGLCALARAVELVSESMSDLDLKNSLRGIVSAMRPKSATDSVKDMLLEMISDMPEGLAGNYRRSTSTYWDTDQLYKDLLSKGGFTHEDIARASGGDVASVMRIRQSLGVPLILGHDAIEDKAKENWER